MPSIHYAAIFFSRCHEVNVHRLLRTGSAVFILFFFFNYTSALALHFFLFFLCRLAQLVLVLVGADGLHLYIHMIVDIGHAMLYHAYIEYINPTYFFLLLD